MTRIVVISDTHARSLNGLPPKLLAELSEADIVVHCGDYTSITLLEELRRVARRFIGVYGNMDPREIRDELPDKTVFEVEGKRIGVIHPAWGGPPWGIEEDIAKEFEGVDIILFGHTHDVCHQTIGGVVFFNPGQAYPSFRNPASAGIVTVGQEGIEVEIKTFE
jgi:hypothetical protein